MKIIFLSLCFCFATAFAAAQSIPATALAEKFAKRMKDSLGLTTQQEGALVAINLDLHNQKMQARQQAGSGNNPVMQLQKIENKRDSLYSTVLSNDEFLIYRQKKKNIIINN